MSSSQRNNATLKRPIATRPSRKGKAGLRCVSCEGKHLKCVFDGANGPCHLCIQDGPAAEASCVLLSAEERRIKRGELSAETEEGEAAANSLLRLAQHPNKSPQAAELSSAGRSYVSIAIPARTFEDLLGCLKKEMERVPLPRVIQRANKCKECAIARISAEKCDNDGWGLRRCARCLRLALPCTWNFESGSESEEEINSPSAKRLRKKIRAYDSGNRSSFLDDFGLRLLLWAASNGQLRIVELLIEIGVDVDVTDDDGNTSLHLSARRGHHLVVRALLNANASVDPQNIDDETPLYRGAVNGDEKVIRSLLGAGAKTNTRNRWSGHTPLHHAVRYDNCRAIELLLTGGSEPNARDQDGVSPLFHAQSEAAVISLLKAGALPNARDQRLWTPLHCAPLWGTLASLSTLLDAGADPNAVDCQGRTPLHLALEWENVETAEFLLQKKSNPNIQDQEGNTPLHVAARRGVISVFVTLVKAGADMSLMNRDGKTAIDVGFSCAENEEMKQEIRRVCWDHRFDSRGSSLYRDFQVGYRFYLESSRDVLSGL